MVSLLKGLLGKARKPIILNGEIVMKGRAPIMASLTKYRLSFEVADNSAKQIEPEQMDELLLASAQKFNSKYSAILTGDEDFEVTARGEVDMFTGAVSITTALYRQLSELEPHELTRQHLPAVREALTTFTTDYTSNYYDIFLFLLNRRLTANHMPITVKGHLVAGLFQPFIVSTEQFKSPFLFPENQWLYDLFCPYEELLERADISNKHLDLSCIAMCDIADALHTYPVFELDKRVFMFMLIAAALSQLSQEASSELAKRYRSLATEAMTSPIQQSRAAGSVLTEEQRIEAIHRDNAQLFAKLVDYAKTGRKAIKVV